MEMKNFDDALISIDTFVTLFPAKENMFVCHTAFQQCIK